MKAIHYLILTYFCIILSLGLGVKSITGTSVAFFGLIFSLIGIVKSDKEGK